MAPFAVIVYVLDDLCGLTGRLSTNGDVMKQRRINEGLLQPLERPALAWIVRRVPGSVTPDKLTALGVLGALLASAGYILSAWNSLFLWLASTGLLINWLGDSLDGTLARFRRAERPRYGFFVDHTTDLLTQVAIGFGLGLSPYVRFEVACIALVAYLTIVAFTFIRYNAIGTLQIAYLGIGPTEVRCLMVGLNVLLLSNPPKPLLNIWAPLSAVDLAILAGSCGALIYFVAAALRTAQQLSDEDPPRQT